MKSIFKRSSNWNIGALTSGKLAYMTEQNRIYDFPFVERLYDKNLAVDRNGTERVRGVLAQMLSNIANYCSDQFQFRLDVDNILVAWIERLSTLHQLYDGTLRMRHPPDTILIGGASDPFIRTVALALRRNGAKTVGFQHGHNMGYTWESARSYIDVSISDEFVCASASAATALQNLAKGEAFTRNCATRFVATNDPTYRMLWDQSLGSAQVDLVRSVMVLGFPMNAIRYVYGTGLFWNFKLDLELRIVRALRQNGYNVLYKPHPDTHEIMKMVMQGEADSVIPERFEAAYGEADALLFTYPLTTTFGFAVCTEKPIVLIDMKGESWYEDIYEKIGKRCALVDAHFDDRNRVAFDTNELLEAIRIAPEKRDSDYVVSYMLSA